MKHMQACSSHQTTLPYKRRHSSRITAIQQLVQVRAESVRCLRLEACIEEGQLQYVVRQFTRIVMTAATVIQEPHKPQNERR